MAKKDKTTTPKPFDLESFAAELHEMLTGLDNITNLRGVRNSCLFMTMEKSSDEAKALMPSEIITKSFRKLLTDFCKLLQDARSVAPETINHSGISCFEEGLFLDFVLYSIDRLQLLDPFAEKAYFLKGNPLYENLWKGKEHHAILHDRISRNKTNDYTGQSETVLEVSKADLPQLEYFYSAIGTKLPELRRPDTLDQRRYEFSVMGKRFSDPGNRVELWRNFFLREKNWGTNLAVLVCGLYADDRANIKGPLANKDIYDYLTKKSKPLSQLMRLPFPVYRITYLHTAVNCFLRHRREKRNIVLDWTDFYKLCLPSKAIAQKLPDEYSVDFPIKILEKLLCSAFWLMFVIWMEFQLPELKLQGEVPNTDQIKTMLTAKDAITKLQNELCRQANEQVEHLFGVQLGEDYQNLDKYWPLLLASETENPYVKKLLDQRECPVPARDKAAKIYTFIQSKLLL